MRWIKTLLMIFMFLFGKSGFCCLAEFDWAQPTTPTIEMASTVLCIEKQGTIEVKDYNTPLQSRRGKYRCGAKRWKNRHYQYRVGKIYRHYFLIKHTSLTNFNTYSPPSLDLALSSWHESLYTIAPRA